MFSLQRTVTNTIFLYYSTTLVTMDLPLPVAVLRIFAFASSISLFHQLVLPSIYLEDSFVMMLVEINQWRAAIGCFRASVQKSSPLRKSVEPFSILFQILKLYWFCYCFIAISILALPCAITIQFLKVHSVTSQSCFLPLFARVHHFAKTVLYTTLEIFKRIPRCIIGLVRYRHVAVRQFLFLYAYFYIGCLTCNTLHAQWLVFRTVLLSGDVETNPGPEALDFCAWNLNSITAYDSLRVSLIEAYNSVYNYDIIGIVETRLDSTVEEDRLALDGYSFVKDNHPQNVKRGGVGLYIKNSLASFFFFYQFIYRWI